MAAPETAKTPDQGYEAPRLQVIGTFQELTKKGIHNGDGGNLKS
jgi:hypothetical protein